MGGPTRASRVDGVEGQKRKKRESQPSLLCVGVFQRCRGGPQRSQTLKRGQIDTSAKQPAQHRDTTSKTAQRDTNHPTISDSSADRRTCIQQTHEIQSRALVL